MIIENILHAANQVPPVRALTEGCLFGKKSFELTSLCYQFVQAEWADRPKITANMKQKTKELFATALKITVSAAVALAQAAVLAVAILGVLGVVSHPIGIAAVVIAFTALPVLSLAYQSAMKRLDRFALPVFKGFEPDKEGWAEIMKKAPSGNS